MLTVCAWMTVACCFDTKAWDGKSPVEPVCTESQHYQNPSDQPLTGINHFDGAIRLERQIGKPLEGG